MAAKHKTQDRTAKVPKAKVPKKTAAKALGRDSGDPAAENFVRGLIERGEAVKAKGQRLPPGATHELVENEKGGVTVQRRRFSSV